MVYRNPLDVCVSFYKFFEGWFFPPGKSTVWLRAMATHELSLKRGTAGDVSLEEFVRFFFLRVNPHSFLSPTLSSSLSLPHPSSALPPSPLRTASIRSRSLSTSLLPVDWRSMRRLRLVSVGQLTKRELGWSLP